MKPEHESFNPNYNHLFYCYTRHSCHGYSLLVALLNFTIYFLPEYM